jgi:drug/metabolite transporter (DMT)-like permease
MAVAAVGVLMFAATLPATRIAVAELDAWWVALARAELAALLGAVALWTTGQRLPGREHWAGLAVVAAGVVLGFPLFTSLAMRSAAASHAAVVVALLPFATAIVATLRSGERPSPAFWLAAAAGSTIVAAFAMRHGGGAPQAADWSLLAAVASAALGYAEGGRLARVLGGWQTIAWALLLAAPLLLVPALAVTLTLPFEAVSPRAWGAFLYLAVFSQLIGFLFWYGGMAIGGVARVSQVQLLQLFVTLIISGALLGEPVDALTWAAAAGVIVTIALGRRAPIRPAASRS